jgi:hypothetical protein
VSCQVDPSTNFLDKLACRYEGAVVIATINHWL